MSQALYGRDHQELDELVDAALDDQVGLALTRGRFRKGYAHVDPNEDAVLAVRGPRGVLLVVADGHGGIEASHAAVEAIATAADRQLATPERAEVVVAELFRAARAEVGRALANTEGARRASRTAISIAVVDGSGLHAVTAGDTSVVVGRRRSRTCSAPHPFLGPDTPVPKIGHLRLRDTDVVVAVSDGVSDFLGGRWLHAVRSHVVSAPSARSAAAGIVRAAMDSGAGDNAAAAVWRP